MRSTVRAAGADAPPYHTIFVLGNITAHSRRMRRSRCRGRTARSRNSLVSRDDLTRRTWATPRFTCPVGQISATIRWLIPCHSRGPNQSANRSCAWERNTLVTRFQYEQNDQNNVGVGVWFCLTRATRQAPRDYDTGRRYQILSPRVINETRFFEYQREAASQTALNTTPTIMVQGNFTGGGSNFGSYSSTQNHFEGPELHLYPVCEEFHQVGGRLRVYGQFTKHNRRNQWRVHLQLSCDDYNRRVIGKPGRQFSITRRQLASEASSGQCDDGGILACMPKTIGRRVRICRSAMAFVMRRRTTSRLTTISLRACRFATDHGEDRPQNGSESL